MTEAAPAPASRADGPPGQRPVRLMNVANALTVLRMALVPAFAWVVVASGMTHPGGRIAACAIFLVASVTDFADGWLARSRGLVTPFGKVADPIADKALTGTALVLLSLYGGPPWWMTGLILAREVGVTGLRFWVLRHGVIAASRGGKLKTVLQILGIAWYLFPWPAPVSGLAFWIMALALAVTLITGGDYLFRALALRRRGTA